MTVDTRPLRIAYLMSRFPKATETFILNEILELQRTGHRVEILPLVRGHETIVQPGAADLVAHAHDLRPWARPVVAAQLHWLRRSPRRYLACWAGAIRGNLGSPRFLLRALAVVPAGARVAQLVIELELDHIHAHWATHPTLAAWVAARLSGRRFTFTAHAHDIYVDRTMLDVKVRDSAKVVTISEANRRLFQTWFGELGWARTVVIHCGVDPAIFAPATLAPGAADSREPSTAGGVAGDLRLPTIVTVASLQPQKGQRVLLAACRLLRDRGRDVRVLLVGEGAERAALERETARLHLGDLVTLAGAQPRDRVAEIVATADVVVQPSVVLASGKTEGIPVALMEALAAERAVVASSVSGIPELVVHGETGLLVPPGDVAALAEAIGRLLDDRELAGRLGRAGRARVLDAFDLHTTTAELVAVFRAAVELQPDG